LWIQILFFFGSGLGSGFNLYFVSGFGSGLIMKNTCTADHQKIAKTFFSKFVHFYSFVPICLLETELNLDPESNPEKKLISNPDPNLQIISAQDGFGSGCIAQFKRH
jgi:hypothetical protein